MCVNGNIITWSKYKHSVRVYIFMHSMNFGKILIAQTSVGQVEIFIEKCVFDDDGPPGVQMDLRQRHRNKFENRKTWTPFQDFVAFNTSWAWLERERSRCIVGTRLDLLGLSAKMREFIGRFLWVAVWQDSMTSQNPHSWSLSTRALSLALKTEKLINPKGTFIKSPSPPITKTTDSTSAQIEGFVSFSNLLGGRDTSPDVLDRNICPDYKEQTMPYKQSEIYPRFFGGGDTRCMSFPNAIEQFSRLRLRAHIQRFMVTGNFCLIWLKFSTNKGRLKWYLGILYSMRMEWGGLPNTRRQSQIAMGVGLLPNLIAASRQLYSLYELIIVAHVPLLR